MTDDEIADHIPCFLSEVPESTAARAERTRRVAHEAIQSLEIWSDQPFKITYKQAVVRLKETFDTALQAAREEERHTHNINKPLDDPPRCVGCGGPHLFDTTIPSPIWNRVIRGAGLPDYLCLICILRAFVKAGEGFTAELWGDGLPGVPIEVVISGETARSAAALSNENTRLRHAVSGLHAAGCRCGGSLVPDPASTNARLMVTADVDPACVAAREKAIGR